MINQFEEELNEQLNWRIGEIATLRKLITLSDSLSKEEENVLKKHLISIFYSYWEGFVKEIGKIYLRHVNELHLKFEQLSSSLLMFYFDSMIKDYTELTDFEKKLKEIRSLYSNLFYQTKQEVILPTEISTNSNLNYKCLKKICKILNWEIVDSKYEQKLNELLRLRNSIAHGDFNDCPVAKLPVDQMAELIVQLMSEMAINAINCYENKNYLNSS